MTTFQRILFPVDLSKQGQAAAPFVAAMAKRFQSEVILLHVVEVPCPWYESPEAMALQAVANFDTLVHESRERLNTYLASELPGASVRRVVAQGEPARAITDCAHDLKADLIMLPTHGYGPFRRLLIGSVTAKILHDADCPVWTGVHTDQIWSHQGAGWQRFLCAVDTDPSDGELLQWAAQFAREQGAQLKVVHAVLEAAPIPSGQKSDTLRDFLLAVAQERVAKMQAEAGTNFDVWFRFGKVGQVVHQAALDQQANLVLIGRGVIRKTLGRLRSQAYTVIRQAPCPVLSV
jgi:nucleotide-binding universal stress UspA family protein